MSALSTTPEAWVLISRTPKAFGYAVAKPVLHRASCRYATSPNAEPYDGATLYSAQWMYDHATGFERACKVCAADIESGEGS